MSNPRQKQLDAAVKLAIAASTAEGHAAPAITADIALINDHLQRTEDTEIHARASRTIRALQAGRRRFDLRYTPIQATH